MSGSHFTREREEERNDGKEVIEVGRKEKTALSERQMPEFERRGECSLILSGPATGQEGRHKAHEHSALLMASGRLPAVRDSTAISPVRLLRVPEAVVASGSAIWNSKHYLLFDDAL